MVAVRNKKNYPSIITEYSLLSRALIYRYLYSLGRLLHGHMKHQLTFSIGAD